MAARSDTGHLLRLYGGAAARVARRGRKKAASEATDATERPVFVVGAPRSGTTFMGASLGRLPGFVDLGEVGPLKVAIDELAALPEDEAALRLRRTLERVRRFGLARRLRAVEQTPETSFILGAALRAYPQAKVVHMIRDGRDVVCSLLEKGWLRAERGGADDVGNPYGEQTPLLGRARAHAGVQRRERGDAARAGPGAGTSPQPEQPRPQPRSRCATRSSRPTLTPPPGTSPGTSTPTPTRWPTRWPRSTPSPSAAGAATSPRSRSPTSKPKPARSCASSATENVPRLPELVPTLPEPARKVARNAIWAYGKATSRFRPLPDFLILGAQKAGTTALYAYLSKHPRITGPSWKEVSYFDRHYARGPSWYRGNFPNLLRTRGELVGEASPSYVFHPLAPERVKELVPEARLIALVRNPVDRALSHYNHEVALGREPLSFEDAVAAEEERLEGEESRLRSDPRYFSGEWWSHTYKARGRYAEQLERWLAVFPREQLLILPSEELLGEPERAHAQVLEFLGASPHRLDSYPRVYERQYEGMKPETRAELAEYFAEPNRRLYELLGRDLAWR